MTLAPASSLGDSVAIWVKLPEAGNGSDSAAENRVCPLGCMAELASHVQPRLLRRQSPRRVPEGLSLALGAAGFAPEAARGLRGVLTPRHQHPRWSEHVAGLTAPWGCLPGRPRWPEHRGSSQHPGGASRGPLRVPHCWRRGLSSGQTQW